MVYLFRKVFLNLRSNDLFNSTKKNLLLEVGLKIDEWRFFKPTNENLLNVVEEIVGIWGIKMGLKIKSKGFLIFEIKDKSDEKSVECFQSMI